MPFIIDADSTSKTESDKRIAREAVVTGSTFHGVSSTGEQAETMSAPVANSLDINKLAHCIAVAETNDCTKGMGITKSNCFGVMTWERGFREGKRYNNKKESYEDFKRIWLKSYKTFPTYSMAVKWTGNDSARRWLNIVTGCYYN